MVLVKKICLLTNKSKLKELSLCHEITVSLQVDVTDLKYFKLWYVLDKIILVYNIKGLHPQVAKKKGFENLSLWQRFNSSDQKRESLFV